MRNAKEIGYSNNKELMLLHVYANEAGQGVILSLRLYPKRTVVLEAVIRKQGCWV
jgi:hypothetical protein